MKLRRILSLCLALAMILSLFGTVNASAMRTGFITRSRTSYTYYSDEQLMEMLEISSIETLNALKASSYEAVMNNTNWNLESYNFNKDNSNHMTALSSLIYGHPELFFVNYLSYNYYSNGRVAYIVPIYDDSYDASMEKHAALEAAAQEIICLFQRTELSDLELAILVHDYLAANYEYHLPTLDLPNNSPEGKYSAYNLLVEGTAVCQGYAEAYAYLMMQFGINCSLCESKTLWHAWNIIEIDGKEYHVDVTWDDPTNDIDGRVVHTYFLLSTDAMNAHEKHAAEDFTGTPNNKEFDDAFWQSSDSPFCLLGDTIYYIATTSNTTGALYSWKDGVSTQLLALNYIWEENAEGYYWPGCHSRLATDGEKLFYSTPKEIFEYDPVTEKSTSVYTYTNDADPYYNIYGFNIKDNNFIINVYHEAYFSTPDLKAENTIVHQYRDEAVENHQYGEAVVVTAPTCQTAGEARYDCIYCGLSKTEVLPAEPDNHTYSEEGTRTKEPTCKVEGELSFKCLYCDAVKTEAIPVIDHDWKDATCTEPKTCSLCGEKEEGVTGYIQVLSTDELKDGDQVVIAVNVNGEYKALNTAISGKITPVTITVDGNMVTTAEPPAWNFAPVEGGGYSLSNGSEYLGYNSSTNFKADSSAYAWGMEAGSNGGFVMNSTKTSRGIYYQISGNRFGAYATSNQNASDYISELMVFKYSSGGGALGHTEEINPGYAATCTEDGLTDGKFCSVCGEIIQKQEVIPATGHTETIVAAVAATCTEDGLTEGKACATCGEVILAQEVVPATGHTEKEVPASDATCTEEGRTAGIICETCGISLSDQTVTPALGHDYIYTPNNDDTHTITCSRCDLHETGNCNYDNGVCTVCGYAEPIPTGSYELATSIAVGDTIIIVCKDKGMEMKGFTTKTNYVDGIAYTDIPSGVYTLVVEAGTAEGTFAFKASDGYLYWKSGNYLYAQDTKSDYTSWTVTFDESGNAIIANKMDSTRKIQWNASSPRFATYSSSQTAVQIYKYVEGGCAHAWDEGEITTPATCTEDGVMTYTCTLCGDTKTEPIPATGHSMNDGEVTTPATCTEDGVMTYTCTVCGDTKPEPIPATGHSFEDGICSNCGAENPCKDFNLTDTLKNGDQLVIYYPAGNTALANTITSANRVATSNVTVTENVLTSAEDTAVFTVNYVDEVNFTLQLADGTYLTSGATGNTLTYTEEASEYSQWYLVPVDGTDLFKIMSTNAAYNDNKNQAIEYYNGFTVYGVKDTELFQFRLYTIGGTVACVHEWNEGEDTTPATCTEDGVKTYTCTLCGNTKTEPIPATGHSMNDGEVTTPATCTEDGVMTYTCTVCGDTKTEPIPATGHSMDESGVCTVCGYAKPTVRPGKFVIAANVDGVYYAMANTFTSKIPGTAITVTGNEVYSEDVADYVVTLVAVDGGYAIQLADGSYLGYPTKGTDLENHDSPYIWTITEAEGEKGTWRVTSQVETRGLVYSAGTVNKFGGYATSNITATSQYYDIELIPVVYDVEFASHNLSLNGNIAINYFINLSDRVVATEGAYLRFTFADGSYEDTLVANLPQLKLRGVTYYKVSCELSAKEMADQVQAQVFYGEKQSAVDLYSITQYADSILGTLKATEESANDNKALIELIERMLHYGAASQLQFQYNTDNLADAALDPVDYSTITISGYDIVKPQGTELVQFAGASLLLKSETTLRLFFRVDASVADQFTISYAGEALTLNQRSGMYYVDVTNIVADKLDELVTVTINDGVAAETDVSYYPLAYCVSVANNVNATHTETLINVVKALFLYNQAANIYFDEV